MAIDPARVDLEHDETDDRPELSAHVPIHMAGTGAAGHHRVRDGRSVIGIRDDQAARRPMALVATLAHELGHVLLLADGRISAQQQDHEPLTDLLTIDSSGPEAVAGQIKGCHNFEIKKVSADSRPPPV
ncbi:hypothetical protein [Actinoplanes regularis]|uniref:hypothetical protein n=1 Tax=Actinoplanes regularis TaxID=52697 RepID=UPI0024A1F37B|nr:hypothetical protein [Actinoplanes regularis]GLW35429.1 hypothetical protein Areg01_83650 [Actinoplanes regularis]